MPRVLELEAGDTAEAWTALGFAVVGDTCQIGSATIRLTGAGGGLRGWTLTGSGPSNLDGVATRWVPADPAAPPAPDHPNGAFRLDHVVVLTPSLDRTLAAFADVGAPARRVDPQRGQAFLWLGDLIVELAERGDDGPASLWGLVAVVPDLDGAPPPGVGDVRDAVQPGRRIATAARAPGLGVPLAFLTPHPGRGAGSNPARA